ncbi:MAG: endonuclease [Bacteroidales bacterium]
MKLFRFNHSLSAFISFLLIFSLFSSCIKSDEEDLPTLSANLKSQVHDILKGHKVISYTPGVWDAYATTDIRPDGYINDLYKPSSKYRYKADQQTSTTVKKGKYNREHTLPQSWFGYSKGAIYSDLHHIYPTDAIENEFRNSYPYGIVNNGKKEYSDTNTFCWRGNMKIPGTTKTTIVFEPNDQIKGNIARTYFYLATRYEDSDFAEWGKSIMLSHTPYPFFQKWAYTMLLEWNRLDPVDQTERNRNEAVAKIQGNRNPFIDDPELAEYIWGEKMGKKYNLDKLKK